MWLSSDSGDSAFHALKTSTLAVLRALRSLSPASISGTSSDPDGPLLVPVDTAVTAVLRSPESLSAAVESLSATVTGVDDGLQSLAPALASTSTSQVRPFDIARKMRRKIDHVDIDLTVDEDD